MQLISGDGSVAKIERLDRAGIAWRALRLRRFHEVNVAGIGQIKGAEYLLGQTHEGRPLAREIRNH